MSDNEHENKHQNSRSVCGHGSLRGDYRIEITDAAYTKDDVCRKLFNSEVTLTFGDTTLYDGDITIGKIEWIGDWRHSAVKIISARSESTEEGGE